MIIKMIKSIILVIIGLNLFSCINTNAQVLQSIDSLVVADTKKPFNGVVLITKDQKTIYSKVNGYSDFDKRKPLRLEDQFVVGSISKQFTAVIILQEYDKGHIDLFLPIRNFLPELSENWADTVTVHHLLTHTHGIVDLYKPTIFGVGTAYQYSQIGYDLLARIAEKVSGKSFAKLSSELFRTCNMKDTFHPDVEAYKHLVKGYVEVNNDSIAFTDLSLEGYPAAGGFISTASDLVLWNENLYSGKLVKERTFQQMTTKQENAVRNHPIFGITEYGYGITIDDKEDVLQWGQTGLIPGFVSMNFYFPTTKTSVIVLENVEYGGGLKETFHFHTQILDVVRNAVVKPR